jgi:outer membrane receptor protein involved in Fe transport
MSRKLCLAAIAGIVSGSLGGIDDIRAQSQQHETGETLPPITVTATRNRTPTRTRDGGSASIVPAQTAPAATSGELPQPGRGEVSAAVSALPAATTTITQRTLRELSVASYGDIFRPLPGFTVSNYGQGAIGYGIALRGFTEAEHGRDVAVSIDGMPVNEVSSLHTPNYFDLNQLIPETVKSIEVVRGPFSVEQGDSNIGGAVRITTKRSDPYASATGEGGTYGTGRALLTYGREGGAVTPYLALEGYRSDGYRDNSFTERFNSFNKVTMPAGEGLLSLRVQAYGTTSGAPGFINRDAVLSGALSPKTAVNGSDGTDRKMQNIVANYTSGMPDQEFSGTLYVNHFDHSRYADFGGGQRVQTDKRTYTGGTLRKVWTTESFGAPVQVLLGGDWRTDFIDTYEGPTVNRMLTAKTIDVGVNQTNLAGFGQVQVKPADWLKLTAGLRYDHFFYDVDDLLTQNRFRTQTNVWSPKFGASLTPLPWLDIYANYGEGFRSPDAALELLTNPGLRPVKIKSEEIGSQFRFGHLQLQASLWRTDIANEVYQPAAGLPVQNLGRSRRQGIELEGRYALVKDPENDVSLFANYVNTSARLRNGGPSLYVPNVPQDLLNLGVEFNVATGNSLCDLRRP